MATKNGKKKPSGKTEASAPAPRDLGDDVLIQLATRVPKELHRKLKLHCVETEGSVMDFVAAAIAEKLAREAG